MKGERKRHRFPKGHRLTPICYKIPGNSGSDGLNSDCSLSGKVPSTWVPRMKKEEFDCSVKLTPDKKSIIACNADNQSLDKKFLRPLYRENGDKFNTNVLSTERRVVEKSLTLSMINEAMNEHIKCSNACKFVNFDICKEVKWGLGWKWTLKCMNCQFQTREFKLYQELAQSTNKRGPKPAAVNYGILNGKLHSSLGNKKLRVILASSGIPPMSYNGMRKAENKVCSTVVKVTNDDMAERLDNLKALQTDSPAPEMNLQIDGTYQSHTFGSRHKLGQGASQVVGVACENMTDKQQIVSIAYENKNCWTGSWLRGLGYEVTCPGGHPDCTANIKSTTTLGERSLGYKIGKDMAHKNILIKNVTTDGDSASSIGVQSAMKEFLKDSWCVKRLADPIHRGQCQMRQGTKAKFSDEMFPGTTVAERKDIQKIFMIDIKERVHAIFKTLMEMYNGNIEKITSRLVKTVDRVVDCYAGKCGESCRWSEILCGGGKSTSWWAKSAMLSSYKLQKGCFKMTEEDRVLLIHIIELKLSASAVKEMPYNFSTNKCEAVNHAISASLPKNRNFGRNGEARTCAAVLRVNNNIDIAVGRTLQAIGAPLNKDSKSASILKKIQQEDIYDKQMHKNPKFKAKKARARRCQAEDYAASKNKRQKTDYQKDHLEPKLPRQRKPPARNVDHPYGKQSLELN